MSIKINDDFMCLEIDGIVVATARMRAGGWWEVSQWPRCFDRNQAITALTVTELLETGRDLDCLAAGMTTDEILAEYPVVTAVGVRAAAAYGAALAREELMPLPHAQ
jgi:uncharacterized protein (DUF433 family)